VNNPERRKNMTIKLIPGPRDEEKISAIIEIHKTSTPEQWEDFVLNCAENETLLDALYYASEYGEGGLQDQEDYFYGLLLDDESNYFAARLGGIEL
jgi:hypothetical protein